MRNILFNLILVTFVSLLVFSETSHNNRRFYVDFEKNEFIKDDEVFRYVSGSLHYFRVPKPYWRDRIRKMKSAGLNAISFYTEWSMHEPYSGIYNFEGQADIEYFLTLAKEENMLVLIRLGPFIAAERDFGGFPYWLLKEKPLIQLRSSNPNYKSYVERWFSVLMPKIIPYLYGNGGTIIMAQIENEYGHNDLGQCDKAYTLWLRDLIHHYINDQALLYTTDECNFSYMKCGKIPNVYATVDFAPTVNDTECFGYMRQVQKNGPLVNSEFYTGWLGLWDEPRPIRYSEDIIRMMKRLLAANVSFNFLMFHGGTNFGFTSGATAVGSTLENSEYQPQLTSYDFSAPLDEAGDPTQKYHDIKRVLKEANFSTIFGPTPKTAPKGNYGTVNMLPVISLFDNTSRCLEPIINNSPLSFEDMDLNHGLVLYETNLPPVKNVTKLPLVINSLRDRAIIFCNNVKLGIMSRTTGNTTMNISVSDSNQKLGILVENQGRISDKKFLTDRKGILSNVTLGKHILGPWVMTRYPLNETLWIESQNLEPDVKPPAFYRGIFVIPRHHKHAAPLDTYLDTSGWSKGVAFVNGVNIGRYWPAVGPQITLYVPGPYLVYGLNTIVIVELENASEDLKIKLVDKPQLDG